MIREPWTEVLVHQPHSSHQAVPSIVFVKANRMVLGGREASFASKFSHPRTVSEDKNIKQWLSYSDLKIVDFGVNPS